MIKIKNFLALLLVLFSVYSYAQLQAYEPNLYGKYEITAGAKGSNNRPDYLYINKPAGATTVYKIYMYNAGTGTGGAVPSNIVTVDGVAYALPNLKTANQVANGTVGAATYKGYSGQVAGAMKTKLDNATAGTVITFSVDEGPQTSDTDGVGIIVIWNNPTKNAGSHFVYIGMDMIVGGAGTTINIPVSPIDKTIPGYEPILGIGINYSTGICDAYYGGGCQLATIKVNGNKITDKAGGYDDGSNNNGALITLGGYGDDPNNNDADELYNIKDQLTNGATNLQFNFKDYSGDVDDVVNAIYFSGVGVTPPACALAPPVTATPISNICPATTVDLNNQGHTGIIPVGASLYWFTNNTHTGTRLTGTQVTEAGAGTYYAFYFDPLNACYSPASSAVTVTINGCSNNCVSGDCNPNTYLNSSDPNTIEYDNMISTFHSTMVREYDGTVKIWGQGTIQNGWGTPSQNGASGYLVPTAITSANYGSGADQLTGKILKFAAASEGPMKQQFSVLTENGLYFWGNASSLVALDATTNNISTGSFRKAKVGTYGVNAGATKADGLPDGVAPEDVKMMFGTTYTLAIVTCDGQAWVLSNLGSTYGDGATDNATNDKLWHRVSTASAVPLTNVVAVRGIGNVLFALTSTGDLYTWGKNSRLGGSGVGQTMADRNYATLMIKPSLGTGVAPKMIGMTLNHTTNTAQAFRTVYYLLATDGNLYAMGDNSNNQLGDATTTSSDTWKQVNFTNTINGTTYTLGGNIAWISPQEHDAGSGLGTDNMSGVNVLTTDGKLWGWGTGGYVTSLFGMDGTPMYMPGRTTTNGGAYDAGKLNLSDKVMAVESGGHIGITIKGCANKFGYLGHRVAGSMGDGTTADATEFEYNYSQTGIISVCGATSVPDVKDLKKCASETADLADAEPAILPPNTTIDWWLDAAGTIPVPNPAAVQAGVYYASFGGIADICIKQITVSNYVATDPEYASCPLPNYCVTGDCNPNTYLNSSDPNTIEYDNMVSVFHSTMVRESNGDVKVWGQGAAENGTQSSGNRSTPGLITNYGTGANKLTGKILKFAMGGGLDATSTQAQQFGVLTENGLYFWGDQGLLVPLGAGNNITTGAFRKATAATYGVAGNKADGLPAGVSPTDVKMMFGTYKTLAIVTCSGQAWVMSSYASYYGDGNSGGAMWHQVSTSAGVPLENVVAVRGTNYDNALFALTSTGDLYTWGNKTYLGGSGAGETLASRTFATLMIKPAGVTPKMIGAVQNSNGPTYYLLATDGRLFALGSNQNFNFADNTQTDSDTWKEITGSQTINGTTYTLGGNIAWISPNEHYQQGRGMNLLTTDAKLWAWGTNSGSMFGGTASRYDTPEYMPGRTTGAYDATKLNLTDRVLAVETGGHTSITVKGCANRYGYVGHKVRGSMGDGTTGDFTETIYNFGQTGILSICGATTVPDVKDIKKCAAATANLANAEPAILPPNTTIEWWLDAAGTIPVPNPAAVQAGVYYASLGGIADKCIKQITVSNYVATDPEYASCPLPNYCVTGCNDNTYLNASDPNTIEYDNMVSGFHTTIVKEEDGTFKIWGAYSKPNGVDPFTVPTAITPANGFNYTGTPLKATVGGHGYSQQVLLTTTGLYVWGNPGISTNQTMISHTIKNTAAFGAVSIGTNGVANASNTSYSKGLPNGVNPEDVKMMFGSFRTLAIVTCTGEAWVLSQVGSKNGDGTTQGSGNSNYVWHRVRTSAAATLNNVVAMRGTYQAMFALTAEGKLYTWGTGTYINSGAAANRTYATEVTKPAGATPKMIGMTTTGSTYQTDPTYYLLATDGKLYAMGDNSSKQLGDGTTTDSQTWKEVTATSGGHSLGGNIVWISPNEHTMYDTYKLATIAVLTDDKKQWGWGNNNGFMLGQSDQTIGYDPIYMPGNSTNANGLSLTDNVIAIETGGHTLMNVKECTNQFGYIGHKIDGSMGDGTDTNSPGEPTYSYSTAYLQLCGAPVPPPVYNLKKCASSTADLNSAVSAAMSGSGYTIEWYMADGVTLVANPASVGTGSYVAKYITSNPLLCQDKKETITVTDYIATDPEFASCAATICFNNPSVTGTGADTKVGITLLKRAGAENADNWPMVRKSGHIALESNTQGFVVTRMTTAQLTAIKDANNAVEGMMSYDTDAKCLKIYDGTDWKCFSTPSCP